MLTLELVPKSTWHVNVRSLLPGESWTLLRRHAYEQAGRRCAICGVTGRLEAHEIWSFDDSSGVQQLEGLTALCSDCHEVKHFGLAEVRGRGRHAFEHLMHVNGWQPEEATNHIADAFLLWQERSARAWQVDIERAVALVQLLETDGL
jgi:hypothetical protein